MTTAAEQLVVEVQYKADSANFKAGTDNAEAAVKSLGDTVNTESDSMNTALRSIDDGVSSTLGSGGTLEHSVDGATSNLHEMGKTASEEIPGAMMDMQDGVGSAVQGVGQAMAALGPGGIIVGAVLTGFGLMANNAKERLAAMQAAADAILSKVEVTAKQTNAAIRTAIEKAADFDTALTQFDAEGGVKGFAKAQEYADKLGVEVDDVIALMSGRLTPDAKELRDTLLEQQAAMDDTYGSTANWQGALTESDAAALSLLGKLKLVKEEQRLAYEAALAHRDVLRDMNGLADGLASGLDYAAQAASGAWAAIQNAINEANGRG